MLRITNLSHDQVMTIYEALPLAEVPHILRPGDSQDMVDVAYTADDYRRFDALGMIGVDLSDEEIQKRHARLALATEA